MFSVAKANALLSAFATDALYMQLHTASPGAAGTANQASVTTRQPVVWGTPTNGVLTASNEPEWPMWEGTNGEVVTHVSFWTLSSGGTFVDYEPIDSSVTQVITNNLTLSPITITLPVAT